MFLNEKHQAFYQQTLAFAQQELLPVIRISDQAHRFPHELVPKITARGLLGVCLPQAYGGLGLDYQCLGLAAEALEFADSSLREWVAVHLGLCALSIWQWGTDSQRETWLPKLASGSRLAAFALNEADAGSDVANLQSTAQAVENGYLLNGEKVWITNAQIADVYLYFAKTNPSAGASGISAFLLPSKSAGITDGQYADKFGVFSSNTGWIRLENVFVPSENRLGWEGEGFKIAMSALDMARFVVAAGSIGLMKACLAQAVAYAKQRIAFGKPIAETQLIQQLLAGMQQRIDLGETYVRQVGWLKNRGERATRESSAAKWYCTEAAWQTANDAMQVLGAAGYRDQYDIARHLRNARAATIYQGTSQIHQLIQASYLLGQRQPTRLRCELPPIQLD